jgi:hypothetical protein
MKSTDRLARKRQFYHQLLLRLNEAKYKEVITSGTYGVKSTRALSEAQLDSLISNAELRLEERQRTFATKPKPASDDVEVRKLRNKCLLVLSQRGITATPKDWSSINKELEAKRYQWVLPEPIREKGLINKRGLLAFKTKDDLTKLFQQLCQIRDTEKERTEVMQSRARLN